MDNQDQNDDEKELNNVPLCSDFKLEAKSIDAGSCQATNLSDSAPVREAAKQSDIPVGESVVPSGELQLNLSDAVVKQSGRREPKSVTKTETVISTNEKGSALGSDNQDKVTKKPKTGKPSSLTTEPKKNEAEKQTLVVLETKTNIEQEGKIPVLKKSISATIEPIKSTDTKTVPVATLGANKNVTASKKPASEKSKNRTESMKSVDENSPEAPTKVHPLPENLQKFRKKSVPFAPLVVPSEELNEMGAEAYLTFHKWPAGLKATLKHTCSQIPIRFFICDNSGSMRTFDGHRLQNDGHM
jgi:hypothetical protein